MDAYTRAFELLCSRLDRTLTLVDVGARYGSVEAWREFGPRARIVCFEADAEECARLNEEQASSNIVYAPYALASDALGRELILTEGLGCSSTYEPIRAMYERYPTCGIMRPVRRVKCPSISLDEYCKQNSIGEIHGLKLDVQGAELEILRGASEVLSSCVFLNVEVEFNRLYENQPIFSDVDQFLRQKGFVLWRLGNLAHYSTGIVGDRQPPLLISTEPGSFDFVPLENGQLFFSDAFYVRADAVATSAKSLDPFVAIAGAALASQYNFWDLATEMVKKSGDDALFRQFRALVPDGQPIAKFSYQIETLKKREAELEREIELLKQQASSGLFHKIAKIFG